MTHLVKIRGTYKYRLYRNDKADKHLHRQIDLGGTIFNHALALQKRYYRLTKKYIPLGVMQAHIAKLRMRTGRFTFWKPVGSQAVQEMLERLDDGYQRFFLRLNKRPPKYKKVRRRKSFTLKQAGWKLVSYNLNVLKRNRKYTRTRGVVEIDGVEYKFIQHRPMFGTVKTLTIKRDAATRLWVCFSVVEEIAVPDPVTPVRMAGLDFGLKTFLTDHTGRAYVAGLYHRSALKRLKKLQSRKDQKPHGSNNRRKAAHFISRTHIRVADKRRDAHYKLAHELCDQYAVLYFEDLNLEGMKRLWGRKVSDLAFAQFVDILKHVALKQNKLVLHIGRFERTTGKCSGCGHEQRMALRERTFECGNRECGLTLDRDHNAAINILHAGASASTNRGAVSRVRNKMRRFV